MKYMDSYFLNLQRLTVSTNDKQKRESYFPFLDI